jgi:mediator of RNA polymerase II transcription subunit 5
MLTLKVILVIDELPKRFTTLVVLQDVEPLSHLSKILYTHDGILDIISLHVRLSDFIAAGLAFLEDYDCETVGSINLS